MADPTTPPEASPYTMILDQSAHLDWDWTYTFAQHYWFYGPTNPSGGQAASVNDVFTKAIADDATQGYYYTVCEMGFLRYFIAHNQDAAQKIRNLGHRFQILSGGITSADCLTCSGEGFIRNYLIGQHWAKTCLGVKPKLHCWLPDDFGQGPELPVLLTAIGFESVAFSRIPGTYPGDYPNNLFAKPDHQADLMEDLRKNGYDFHWKASDGSKILTHWNGANYSVGDVYSTNFQQFCKLYNPDSDTNPSLYASAKTPFMYIPIDDDFSMPFGGLQSSIESWNKNSQNTWKVDMKQGTFDQFVAGVKRNLNSNVVTRSFNGTPMFTGPYASRPELKILHYETVRSLIAAEVIGLLTQPWNSTKKSTLPLNFWERIDQAWNDFAPSTHHDYMCGTANDAVYACEQLPLLQGAAYAARSLSLAALNALTSITAGVSDPAIIVVNTLGFTRTGVAVIEGICPFGDQFTWPDNSTTYTQTTADGGMLVYTSIPSFGYVIGQQQENELTPIDKVTLTTTKEQHVFSNEYLTATISSNAKWGLVSLTDAEGNEVLSKTSSGNAIAFYDDSTYGGLYAFANEWEHVSLVDGTYVKGPNKDGKLFPIETEVCMDGPGLGTIVLEQGPLRARVRTEVQYNLPERQTGQYPVHNSRASVRFIREYELRAGEPFLRMTTTGAAPPDTSVMTTFPLANTVQSITHGTGYHWTDVQPLPGFWDAPVFQATHDFLLPKDARGSTLAAVYHAGMPAWAFDSNNTLIGCLLRNNVSGMTHGANGTDPAPHTQRYAVRVPLHLGGPETGQPLQEAQGFHTPLYAMRVPANSPYPGMIDEQTGQLAGPPKDTAAILTVAKPGTYDPTSMVLRIYQPTNGTEEVQVTLPSAPTDVKLVTAAELGTEAGDTVSINGNVVSVTMHNAVSTISIGGMGRPLTGLERQTTK